MRSAFNKDLLRTVGHSLGRFLALAGIVALGCGFYAGLRMTAPDMKLSADRFYDGTSLMDVRVLSSMGLTDDDLQALAEVDGVDEVMGAYEVDAVATVGGEQYALRVHSLSASALDSTAEGASVVLSDDGGYLNRLILMEGSWPEHEGECVLLGDVVLGTSVSVGDTITLGEGTQDVSETLATDTYTVVGFVRSSYYATTSTLGTTSLGSGSIQQVMYVPESDFADDLPYTEAFLTVEGAADVSASSDAYDEIVTAAEDAVQAIAPEREQARADGLRADAQAELDEARVEYEQQKADAEAQLADAKAELDEAAETIAASERELADGQEEYDAGVVQLAQQRADAESQFADAEAQLADAQAQLDAQAPQLEEAAAQLEAAWAQWEQLAAVLGEDDPQVVAAKETLDAQQAEYDAGKAAYDASVAQVEQQRQALQAAREEAEAQIAAAEAELEEAAAQLASGRAQLEEGKADYEEGLASYEEQKAQAEQEFADAEQELAEAQQAIDDIEEPEWYVMDRSQNYGTASFEADANRIDSIASVFPFIFFLVAALVALTTMTRMVEEERVLIGTYKALGYTRGRIASKYLVYAGVASLTGAVVGIVVLSQLLPMIIMEAYSIIYCVPRGPMPIDAGLAGLSAGLGVGITLVATWAAATATLRESPAQLMLPRAPKSGKRILLERVHPLWRHLSFSWKVTFRNLFRYKKRLVMTVVGIAGCTALLLTGLGLSDAINDIIDKQFGPILKYNATIVVDEGMAEDDADQLEEALGNEDWVSASMDIMRANVVAGAGEDEVDAQIVVPQDPDSLSDYVSMHTRLEQENLELGQNGVVLSEKLATQLGIDVGDEVVVRDQDEIGNATGQERALEVTGIMENYIDNYLYVGSAAYEEAWGESVQFNALFAIVSTDEGARVQFGEALDDIDGVKTVTYNDETIETYESMLASVNMVVVVLVVAAAALAFIVLYNLTNINVAERVREIATLKVLGFTPGEVDAYIYREITLLSVIGAAAGLVLGVFMESFVVQTAEVDSVMFGREIHLASFVAAFVLTMVFAAFVMFVMRRKLSGVNMVESLKSNE